MIYRGLTHEFDLAFTTAGAATYYFSYCLIGSMTILHVKPDFQIHAFSFVLICGWKWIHVRLQPTISNNSSCELQQSTIGCCLTKLMLRNQ